MTRIDEAARAIQRIERILPLPSVPVVDHLVQPIPEEKDRVDMTQNSRLEMSDQVAFELHGEGRFSAVGEAADPILYLTDPLTERNGTLQLVYSNRSSARRL